MRSRPLLAAAFIACLPVAVLRAADYTVEETDEAIHISTPLLEATIAKTGYVTGVKRQSFLDKKTGFRDPGFGLDIIDWIMEPGSDRGYREQLDPELVYRYENDYHGQRAKRSIEGPQICTQAKRVDTEIVRGKDFVAVKQWFRYRTAAPGKKTGSVWTQWLVFPTDTRYFISSDWIESVNDGEKTFFRMDMPGHVRHNGGDTFEQIYLSYKGRIPPAEFTENFPPDEKFHYLRERDGVPERMIRAYQLRDSKTKKTGPWLAGMTLDPAATYEAWCHQRGYVCFIQEIGGRPIEAGESFGAAFIVGYFDSIDQMEKVYDAHKGFDALEVSPDGWELVRKRRVDAR